MPTTDLTPAVDAVVRAYSVKGARHQLGDISHDTFYALVRAGKLSTRKIGSRTVVTAAEIDRFIDALPEGGADTEGS